ncbi:Eukaryotic aspartyl protease [Aphelenchoides besseyi]|nr:Eukaryotic aspartyl protease [Aphelenchoides besseyi]KAI6212190.1 Eukaryotic aspartyl protease [Aphelenchoides besseyi]
MNGYLSSVLLCALLLTTTISSGFEIGMRRKTKTRRPTQGHLARDEAANTSGSGYAEKVQAFQNLEYKGTVSVGDPPQSFEVVMDTGSDIFWLPRVGCSSSGPDVQACRTGRGLYDPSQSSTAVDLHQPFQIRYGTGSAVGNYIWDTMSFGDSNGNVTVGNVTIGAATRMSFSDTGILGLSFAQPSDPTPVFQLAVERGVFKEPIFSVFLADCDEDCEDGGLIKFGGTDTQHCEQVVGAVNVVGNSPYWLFKLNAITANRRAINIGQNPLAIVDTEKNSNRYCENITGTSIIAGETSVIRQIASALNAQQIQDTYLVPCNAQFQLSFNINNYEYTIDQEQLVLQGPAAMGNGGNSYCQLALDGDNSLDFLILGSPFIRGFCLIHNIKDKTISFAPVRSNNTGSSRPNNSRPSPSVPTNGGRESSPWGSSSGNQWPFAGVDGSSPWNNPFDGSFGNSFGNRNSPWSPFGSQSPFDGWNSFGNSPWTSPWTSPWNSQNGAYAFGNPWFYENGRFKREN